MSARHKSCCFTGHRPEKLPWRRDEDDPRAMILRARLLDFVDAAYRAGLSHFICGMARGCDLYFCEAVLQLRTAHPEITLEAAIPFDGQAARWAKDEKARYFRLVSQCDYETVLQANYDADCMRRRNQYMIDNSAMLIAVYDGTPGGTMQTVNYAKRCGLDIAIIRSDELAQMQLDCY